MAAHLPLFMIDAVALEKYIGPNSSIGGIDIAPSVVLKSRDKADWKEVTVGPLVIYATNSSSFILTVSQFLGDLSFNCEIVVPFRFKVVNEEWQVLVDSNTRDLWRLTLSNPKQSFELATIIKSIQEFSSRVQNSSSLGTQPMDSCDVTLHRTSSVTVFEYSRESNAWLPTNTNPIATSILFLTCFLDDKELVYKFRLLGTHTATMQTSINILLAPAMPYLVVTETFHVITDSHYNTYGILFHHTDDAELFADDFNAITDHLFTLSSSSSSLASGSKTKMTAMDRKLMQGSRGRGNTVENGANHQSELYYTMEYMINSQIQEVDTAAVLEPLEIQDILPISEDDLGEGGETEVEKQIAKRGRSSSTTQNTKANTAFNQIGDAFSDILSGGLGKGSNNAVEIDEPIDTVEFEKLCYNGNERKVMAVIEGNFVDLSHKNAFGETWLHVNANIGKRRIVECLLNAKVIHIDEQTARGETALHIASKGNHTKVVRALIEAGASPLIKDEDGNTAYDVATKKVKQIFDGYGKINPKYAMG